MTFIAVSLIILVVAVIINSAAIVFISKILEDYYDRFEIIDRTLKQKPEENEATKAIRELVKEYEEEKLKEID